MKRLFLLMAMILLVGCGQQTTKQEDSSKKEWVIGLDDTFAPMGFRDENNELVGFDVEIAQEIAEINGWSVKFQPINWAMKEQELNAGNIDMIWNGYTITEARKEKVAFSEAYLANRQIVVVMATSEVQTLNGLNGKTVALQAESSAIDAVRSKPEFMESLKEMPEYATNTEVFKDLEIGRADAIVVDEVLARYYMKTKGESDYRVLEEDFGKEEFGVGMRKQDTELIEKINAGLKTLKDNGSYDRIYKKWFSEN